MLSITAVALSYFSLRYRLGGSALTCGKNKTPAQHHQHDMRQDRSRVLAVGEVAHGTFPIVMRCRVGRRRSHRMHIHVHIHRLAVAMRECGRKRREHCRRSDGVKSYVPHWEMRGNKRSNRLL